MNKYQYCHKDVRLNSYQLSLRNILKIQVVEESIHRFYKRIFLAGLFGVKIIDVLGFKILDFLATQRLSQSSFACGNPSYQYYFFHILGFGYLAAGISQLVDNVISDSNEC